jgi:hypothetical protein
MPDARLDEFRQEVNWNLACGPMADVDLLPVTGDDGGRPVVVALEDEQLAILLGRLRAVGGYANLFVRGAGGVRTLSVIDRTCLIPEPDDDLTAPAERPGANATVGMFLDYLDQRPGGVVLSTVSSDAERPALARDARLVEFTAATS